MKRHSIFAIVKTDVAIILGFLLIILSCKKDNNSGAGKYSFANTGNCGNAVVLGAAFAGVNLQDSNYMRVELTAITPGPFTITTDTVNGIYFNNTGVLTSSPINTFRLIGHGIPERTGTTTLFLTSSDGSKCPVSFVVNNFIETTEYGWQFYDYGVLHKGDINLSIYENHVTGEGFYIEGAEFSNTDFFFGVGISAGYGKIADNYQEYRELSLVYREKDSIIFSHQNDFSVFIESYNADSRIVTGRFHGAVYNDWGDGLHDITDGRFRARLDGVINNPPPELPD